MSPHRPGSESCREVFAKLSEYLDEELDSGICGHIESHLDDCPPCAAFLESLRRTVGAVGSLETPDVDDELRRRVVDGVRAIRLRMGSDDPAD